MKAGSLKPTVTMALTRPGGHAGEQAHRHGGDGIGAEHLQEIGRGAAGERQHRPDREVDVAGGDDVGEPDGDQRQLGVVEQDREAVGQVPPVVRPEREAGQPQQRGQDDGERVAAGEELAEPGRRQRHVGRHRPLGLHALDRDAADLVGRRRRLAAEPRPEAAGDLAADEPGLDEHGDDEQEAEEDQHRARRQGELGVDRDVLAVDDDDAGDRTSLRAAPCRSGRPARRRGTSRSRGRDRRGSMRRR